MREDGVLVDDDYDDVDPDERYTTGTRETLGEALAVCRAIVDRCRREEYRLGISSADALYSRQKNPFRRPARPVLGGGPS